ncbi:MAG: hypothetical protein M1837_005735 [Sclerophora amabilis]|nr:MAG: hypothetical protein M1837_005735 [Sclerophora amabilis]
MSGCSCETSAGCQDEECECLDQMDPERRRFPYVNDGDREGTLSNAHIDTRDAIFECNLCCKCGSDCPNKLVQRGRKVPLEIFKTRTRGWGLRCPRDLRKGDFVDVYRGEIITEAECRERDSHRMIKDVYTFALDKFHADNPDNPWAQENKYVVDGEFLGGPTRFINHSCDPNLRQFTVSYHHADPSLYELAFFAIDAIEAGTELTFDYVDKDVEEGAVTSSKRMKEGMTRCLCGAENCRRFLWI